MSERAIGFQYATVAQQREASTLGMWAFLATEVLFFGALIAAYLNYRIWLGDEFIAAASLTKVALGTANTAVLLTSSACMAMAVMTFEAGSKRAPVLWLTATALLGLAFVVIKASEWWLDYQEHLIPALNFDLARHGGVAEIFFVFYFCATGLHALHLLIGISIVAWLATAIGRGRIVPGGSTTRLVGLYWHFVDVVWIFLFPLIYLAGRNG
ncbi:cytochrome c oxidase subunit 3 [Sphingomonas segetis]|jgi:cytochrome c oxidase subunit 3|uniref:cytochrome c oxidase subunit 3 n=1 Tax=Sphingomonas segetis TaxID=1104779 RepID=UPI0012D36ACE|nr:cytochrome c oxidase subunit 3 [Sphingomonas segetis]